jgi:hypothetical protein
MLVLAAELVLALADLSPKLAIEEHRAIETHAAKVATDVLQWRTRADVASALVDAGFSDACVAGRKLVLAWIQHAEFAPPVLADMHNVARHIVVKVAGNRSAASKAAADAWCANLTMTLQLARFLGLNPWTAVEIKRDEDPSAMIFATAMGTTGRKGLLGISAVEAIALLSLAPDSMLRDAKAERRVLAETLLEQLENTGALLGALMGFDGELDFVPEAKRRTVAAIQAEAASDANWRAAWRAEVRAGLAN